MITRSNLAEQLREYQIRSKHDWASVSFFSSTSSNITTSRFSGCRVDVVIFVIWELIILAFLVFSAVSLYFRHIQLAFILVCVTVLLLLCMKITKQVRLARKKKRRMLLPLSM
ncbi:NADH-ubiquinone oxidoreductase chain [Senna tora]|uniref:NADH-ubiquinone oxidoreductase chain n=1 Tax=Senna tora TaxID=362788 RepID=A0A834TZN1_9FABA|nr:NADH-ubiquinone oxidoreductase chain [Senna tora]